MATNTFINTDTSADLIKPSHEKNKDVSHLLRYVHTETLRKSYQQLEDTKSESEIITISEKDLEAACTNDNINIKKTGRTSVIQQIDSIIRASETVLCYSLWLILAAISGIYQASYIAFSIYHIIFSLYFFTPDADNVNLKSIARYTILLIGGFFVAMWVAFLCKMVYDGKSFSSGEDNNILFVLHKECK